MDFYVINLKERDDRLKDIKNEFYNYNLKIINAEKNIEGWKGCFESHKKCIKHAIENKIDYIIVLEDDCIKTEYFDKKIKIILEYLKNNKNKWDIFLGGVTSVYDNIEKEYLDKDIGLIYLNYSKTSHFIIYNSSCYNIMLNKNINIPIDKSIWLENKLKIVSIIPFIAKQKIDYSSIEKKNVNYNSRFEAAENYLLKINK